MSTQWKRRKVLLEKEKKKASHNITESLTDINKELIRAGSYLGKKGYTIPRELIPDTELEFIHKDLFVKPVSIGPSYGPPVDPDEGSYPVYRENAKKIYIPRFYGLERYGQPDRSEITEGDSISVNFPKPLRDYQDKIVDVYMNHIQQPICSESDKKGNGGILEVPCGRGKCVGINTPIMMYDGTIKMIQDIKVGDIIMGDDSTPRNVLTLARGREQMYKVKPHKGDSYTVNESHILSLKYSSTVNKNTPKGTVRDISVLDYLKLPKSYHGKGGVLVGYRVPIIFPKREIKIDPYLLGYWLGDGSSRGTLITTQESYVLKYITNDCFVNKHKTLYLQYTGAQYDYRINSINKTTKNSNEFMKYLRDYNLIQNKHIPYDYKCNERSVQLELLAGIIDSDGSNSCNSYDIIQKNEKILDDIIFIAKSLGFAAYKSVCKKSCMYKGEKKEGTYYRTTIHGKGLDEIPVKCPRKQVSPRKQIKDALNTRIKIEKLEIDDYYGFEIDGNHRFVLGDFTVTHNTVMALKIIAEKGKKTLIIVHKEFLMNQWIDRANEFLPGVKIGKIQGPIFDIEGKDIVIGMLQTLYDRALPENAFDSFGLTIVDEVHRIGSEQFSKTLLRVVSPNMLGISATVDRKDKLTKVLYMFIGPKIYTEARENDDPVCVRALEYISSDSHFNETEYDFRGQTKYSTMISKLSDFGPRSDFIVRVLGDLIKEGQSSETDTQIMVLCHNRSMLKYLYEAINHRGFATVGYYIGGMKQSALQETEDKQIVLATYAMAAEALDIKTLSVLVMASPKTDITQSVGRILRVRHDNPIVVDIVDRHDTFQNQWRQRKTFYRKCNYRILSMDSVRYQGMSLDWKTDKTWSKVFEPRGTMKKEEVDKSQRKCLISIKDLDIDNDA
jgi:superfamily II DNA or RNA helicase